jgi:hypothetical protein
VTADAVSLILETINRINQILDSLAREQIEPEGNDEELIGNLARMVEALRQTIRRSERSVISCSRCSSARYCRATSRSTVSSAVFVRRRQPAAGSLEALGGS